MSETLELRHSQAILPELKTAWEELGKKLSKSNNMTDITDALDEYNAVCEKAAEAFHKDTSYVNSLEQARAAFCQAGKDREHWIPPYWHITPEAFEEAIIGNKISMTA